MISATRGANGLERLQSIPRANVGLGTPVT